MQSDKLLRCAPQFAADANRQVPKLSAIFSFYESLTIRCSWLIIKISYNYNNKQQKQTVSTYPTNKILPIATKLVLSKVFV